MPEGIQSIETSDQEQNLENLKFPFVKTQDVLLEFQERY